MQKKKILYVITKSNWGGAQRYVFDLVTTLPRDQYEVVVACGGGGPLVSRLTEAKIRVIPVPFLVRDINFIKEIFSLISLWRIFRASCPLMPGRLMSIKITSGR